MHRRLDARFGKQTDARWSTGGATLEKLSKESKQPAV